MVAKITCRPSLSQIYYSNLVFEPSQHKAVLVYRFSGKGKGKFEWMIRFNQCSYFLQTTIEHVSQITEVGVDELMNSNGLLFKLKQPLNDLAVVIKDKEADFYIAYLGEKQGAIIRAAEISTIPKDLSA